MSETNKMMPLERWYHERSEAEAAMRVVRMVNRIVADPEANRHLQMALDIVGRYLPDDEP